MDHRREGLTIYDRLDSLEKDLKATQEDLKATQEDLKATQEDLKVAQEDLKVAQEDLKDALSFMDRIVNGEIINAACALFGHISTSKQSKAELHRRIIRCSVLCSPGQESANQISTTHENPWISARNQTAHKITIDEAKARTARQGKDADFLGQWVDLISIHGRNTRKSLDEVAFKERMVLTTEGAFKPITDLPVNDGNDESIKGQ
ncbi:hypothetical protein MMC29_007249 [Sticta canariensis]|nr:hypothetical protein [Sticta canariensis]